MAVRRGSALLVQAAGGLQPRLRQVLRLLLLLRDASSGAQLWHRLQVLQRKPIGHKACTRASGWRPARPAVVTVQAATQLAGRLWFQGCSLRRPLGRP